MTEPNIRINPLNDLLFKKMLATEDKKTILQGFIRDFFDINAALDEIILVTPYSIKSYMEYTQITDNNETINQDDNPVPVHVMRETLRDITVVVKTADLLIELQIYNDKYFIIRTVYYLCDRFCSIVSLTILNGETIAIVGEIEETWIYKQFQMLAEGKSAVIVTHRLGSAKLAHRIVVMDAGKVIDVGTHDTFYCI